MININVTIKISFEKGVRIPDEAKRLRKIFTDNEVEIVKEKITDDSVAFTIACDDSSLKSVCEFVDHTKLEVDSAVADVWIEKPKEGLT